MSAILETSSGKFIDVRNPAPGDIRLRDIAHALSMQCRFGGHTRYHYSVAQHSINVSYLVPKEHAMQALLHDATEAYLVDIPTPIKKHLPDYYPMEAALWNVIARKYGVAQELHRSVKEADARICISEKIDLIGPEGLDGPGWINLTSVFKPYTHDELDRASVDFDSYSTSDVADWFIRRFTDLSLDR